MTRYLSHSETAKLLDCQAAWDFKYGGRLAGTSLEPVVAAPILREGRAWGAGVAAWHGTDPLALEGRDFWGIDAIRLALDRDAEELKAAGVYLPADHVDSLAKLSALMRDYGRHAHPLDLTEPERELDVPIPNARGHRLVCHLDGMSTDSLGPWVVEFKLRSRLMSFEQVVLSRQTRWYAWAYREETGRAPTGVIVDERLNDLPNPVRFNKDGAVSKVQSCTPREYRDACKGRGQAIDEDVERSLSNKVWQARHTMFFRPDELDEAGEQLRSTARLIGELESGRMYPIRNPSPGRCPRCEYREICPNPLDAQLAAVLFHKVPPKRLREGKSHHGVATSPTT